MRVDVEKFDNYIFDCDGVLWRGEEGIEGAKECIADLQQKGKRVIFLTNNSTKSREKIQHKLERHGIKAPISNIYGSAHLLAAYLKQYAPQVRRVYVIGREGILEELQQAGIACAGGPSDDLKNDLNDLNSNSIVDAVIVGYDPKINYYKIATAMRHLAVKEKCLFIATNTDSSFPDTKGLLPGTGVIVSAVATAAGRDPIVVGKPNRMVIDLIEREHFNGCWERERTLVVGDRLETDIAMGSAAGLQTLLVESGVDRANIESSPWKPDYILPSIKSLDSSN